jgi:Na+:H+ antiporter, NhaC family
MAGGLPKTSEDAAVAEPAGRPASAADAILVFVVLLGLLALSYWLYGKDAASGPNQIALIFAGLVAGGIAHKNGMPWAGVRQAVVDGVSSGLGAIFILLAVGALIGTWALGGTIVAMIYYGLDLLRADFFYASTLIICALIAVAVGSSWTVIGTIGVGLMGVAANLGLSPEIAAGAIVSGAFFGDRTSPLSDTVNLNAAVTGADLFTLIRESLWTSIPSFVIALALFAFVGHSAVADQSHEMSELASHFNVSVWAFAPLALVFALALMRVSPFVTVFSGALLGGVVAILINPAQVIGFAGDPSLPIPLAMLKGVWTALATGYVSNSGDPATDALLSRGGMAHMLPTVWLIMAALAFGAIVEHAGLLKRIVDPIAARVVAIPALVASVVVSAFAANVVTADQYMAVALPGRMFRAVFEKRGYAPVVLARAIGDTGTVTSALIPWNSCGAYVAATLAVPTFAFAPFAFFCLLSPLMTIAIAVLSVRMLRAPPDARPARSAPGESPR